MYTYLALFLRGTKGEKKMNPIYYQYSLTNFVVFDEYVEEHFEETAEEDHYHQTILSNLNISTNMKVKRLTGHLRRIFASNDCIKEYLIENKGAHTYNPLSDTPELYLELNKVELFDNKQLKKFISDYGIPYNEHMVNSGEGVYKSNLFKENGSETALRAMDIMMFYEKLIKFKSAVTLWNDIKQNNIDHLRKIKDKFSYYATFNQENKTEFVKEFSSEEYLDWVTVDLGFFEDEERKIITDIFINNLEKISRLQEKASAQTSTWNKVKNCSDKEIALAYLNLELNKLRSGYLTTTYINDTIAPAVRFENLLEVAAFQLKKAIFTDTKLELCLNCEALFEPKHALQKFCSPLPGRKRSTCENTFNQRIKRQRRKEKNSK